MIHYDYANNLIKIFGLKGMNDFNQVINYSKLEDKTIIDKINKTIPQFKELFELTKFDLSRLNYKLETFEQSFAFLKKVLTYLDIPYEIYRNGKKDTLLRLKKENILYRKYIEMFHDIEVENVIFETKAQSTNTKSLTNTTSNIEVKTHINESLVINFSKYYKLHKTNETVEKTVYISRIANKQFAIDRLPDYHLITKIKISKYDINTNQVTPYEINDKLSIDDKNFKGIKYELYTEHFPYTNENITIPYFLMKYYVIGLRLDNVDNDPNILYKLDITYEKLKNVESIKHELLVENNGDSYIVSEIAGITKGNILKEKPKLKSQLEQFIESQKIKYSITKLDNTDTLVFHVDRNTEIYNGLCSILHYDDNTEYIQTLYGNKKLPIAVRQIVTWFFNTYILIENNEAKIVYKNLRSFINNSDFLFLKFNENKPYEGKIKAELKMKDNVYFSVYRETYDMPTSQEDIDQVYEFYEYTKEGLLCRFKYNNFDCVDKYNDDNDLKFIVTIPLSNLNKYNTTTEFVVANYTFHSK